MKIEAVIFDMDGLLIDSEPLWRKAIIQNFQTLGIELTEDDCKKTMGYRLEEVVIYWRTIFKWESVSNEHVVKSIIQTVKQLVLEEAQMLPGAKRTLDMLKDNYPLALASSSSMELINAFLERYDLHEYFKEIHSAEHEKYGKPHPGVFLSAAQSLGVQPESCLVFEDSFHGLIAAKAACMKCIAVPDIENKGDKRFFAADLILDSLEDFNLEMLIDKNV